MSDQEMDRSLRELNRVIHEQLAAMKRDSEDLHKQCHSTILQEQINFEIIKKMFLKLKQDKSKPLNKETKESLMQLRLVILDQMAMMKQNCTQLNEYCQMAAARGLKKKEIIKETFRKLQHLKPNSEETDRSLRKLSRIILDQVAIMRSDSSELEKLFHLAERREQIKHNIVQKMLQTLGERTGTEMPKIIPEIPDSASKDKNNNDI